MRELSVQKLFEIIHLLTGQETDSLTTSGQNQCHRTKY